MINESSRNQTFLTKHNLYTKTLRMENNIYRKLLVSCGTKDKIATSTIFQQWPPKFLTLRKNKTNYLTL